MEEGHGKDRNDFLRRHNIETFLIKQPEESLLTLPEDIMRDSTNQSDHRTSNTSFTEGTWSPELPFHNIVGKQNVSAIHTQANNQTSTVKKTHINTHQFWTSNTADNLSLNWGSVSVYCTCLSFQCELLIYFHISPFFFMLVLHGFCIVWLLWIAVCSYFVTYMVIWSVSAREGAIHKTNVFAFHSAAFAICVRSTSLTSLYEDYFSSPLPCVFIVNGP